MAGNIKGITIEFQGDTTQLDRALRDVDKNTKGIDKELRQVNKDLKFNPTSIELWRQKQDLLKAKITDTSNRLKMLKQAQAQMDAKGVDKNSEEYRNLQREIIETESKLKTFKGQLQAVGNVKLRVASEQLKELGSKATAAGNAMRGISRAAGVLAGAIGALAYKSGKWADDLNTMQKQYRISTKQLQLYAAAAKLVDVDVNTITKAHVKLTKTMGNAAKGSASAAESFEKLGVSITNEDGSLRDNDAVFQDAITALGKMGNETERDALAMDLFGKSASELNPLIVDGGETYKRVAETMQKYGLDFVDQDTLDKANEFNNQIDTIKSVGVLAFQSLGASLAGVLEPVLEKVVELVGKFANWISGIDPVILAIVGGVSLLVAAIAPALLLFGALATAAGAVAGVLAGITAPMIAIGAAIAGIVAVVATALAQSTTFRETITELVTSLGQIFLPVIQQLLGVFKTLFATIKDTVMEVANQLAPVFQALTPIIQFVAKLLAGRLKVALSVISAAIRIVGAVVKSLATIFSATFLAIFNTANAAVNRLKGIFAKVKSALVNPFETAKNAIKGIVDKIKGFFGFSVKSPHIPLPHFSISPKGWNIGDLVKGKIPSLSIKWYAKGGIFNSPTLAGIGEAGPEAVVPLDKLWDKMSELQGGMVVNVYGSDNMSVNELALAVEQKIIEMQKRRRLAWQ
jgi:phage-related minor tail protein